MRLTLCGAITLLSVPAAVAQTIPSPIGDWSFFIEKDHPVALAKGPKYSGDIEALRIECGASGSIEYVPYYPQIGSSKTLYVHGMDDIEIRVPLVGQRVSGKDNAVLSKQFLLFDSVATKNGQKTFQVGMSLNGPEQGQPISMGGFAQVREFMLKSCKSASSPTAEKIASQSGTPPTSSPTAATAATQQGAASQTTPQLAPNSTPAPSAPQNDGVAPAPSQLQSSSTLLPIGSGFPNQASGDVSGIRPGMTLREAEPLLKKASNEPTRPIVYQNTQFLYPGPQFIWFATNGTTGDQNVRRPDTLSVVASKLQAGNEIVGIYRELNYKGNYADIAEVRKSLIQKYGQPTFELNTILSWTFSNGIGQTETTYCPDLAFNSLMPMAMIGVSANFDARYTRVSKSFYDTLYSTAPKTTCDILIVAHIDYAPVEGRARSVSLAMVDYQRVRKGIAFEQDELKKAADQRRKALEQAPKAATPKF